MKNKIIFDEQDGTSGFFIIPKSKLYSKKSNFQQIEVFDHDYFGKILRIDGCFQTSELDEYLYHEPLVQFALFSHPNPKKVLIIGGGDGGSLKEVVKHKGIKEIVMVELDKEVVNVSKKFLGKINKNAFEDRRVKIIYRDGIKYLGENKEKYDVIILDLTDPSGESLKLYIKDFYEKVKERLNRKGIVSLHTESYLFYPKVFGRIISTLKSVFNYVSPHGNDVPLYGGTISFALCSDKINFKKLKDSEIRERLNKNKIKDLKYFSPSLFIASLELPKYVKEIIRKKHTLVTFDNPLKKEREEIGKKNGNQNLYGR